jgi:hypothetical protein
MNPLTRGKMGPNVNDPAAPPSARGPAIGGKPMTDAGYLSVLGAVEERVDAALYQVEQALKILPPEVVRDELLLVQRALRRATCGIEASREAAER